MARKTSVWYSAASTGSCVKVTFEELELRNNGGQCSNPVPQYGRWT